MSKPQQAGLRPRERWYALIGVVLAIGLIGLVWVLTDRTELPSVGEVSRPTPDMVLATLDGGEINVSQQQGKVVLVNFWGTWCEPCIRETPALQEAYARYRDEGLLIVGVNVTGSEFKQGNTLEDVQAFADEFGVEYPIALDVEGEASQAFRVLPLPTSFFIDTQGTIRFVRVGEINADEIAVLFDALRQESAARR
ncbi:MAG: TlpA family protein disulfide reductase [Chloroflexaceae bacterium]|nr:TlpA family protein disulfide reductase [Chloroflexaceae bacterium]